MINLPECKCPQQLDLAPHCHRHHSIYIILYKQAHHYALLACRLAAEIAASSAASAAFIASIRAARLALCTRCAASRAQMLIGKKTRERSALRSPNGERERTRMISTRNLIRTFSANSVARSSALYVGGSGPDDHGRVAADGAVRNAPKSTSSRECAMAGYREEARGAYVR